jgi:hypothetical protein
MMLETQSQMLSENWILIFSTSTAAVHLDNLQGTADGHGSSMALAYSRSMAS